MRDRRPSGHGAAEVISRQTGIHPNLENLLARRAGQTYQGPMHQASETALAALEPSLRAAHALVLDAGCGDGESTGYLARRHPDALVLGVDKSAARLAKARSRRVAPSGRCQLLRAELGTVWRWLAAKELRPGHQYLLYPNPWPKPEHLARRWHGHPVFPMLLALGGRLELRTNWAIYAREFEWACHYLGHSHARCEHWRPDEPITAFERKYLAAGQMLYRVVVPSETDK